MTKAQLTDSTGRLRQMIKSIGIYAVGSIGSKIITFLMIPLYTFYVRPDDYGYYDLCLSTVLFLCPLISLQLRDGSFRFLMDAKDQQSQSTVISESFHALLMSTGVFFAVAIGISIFTEISYLWWTFALLIMMMLQELIAQMVRGLSYSSIFVIANIISAGFIGAFSVMFVVCLDMGIKGIFLANILARLLSIAFIEVRIGIFFRYLNIHLLDSKLLRRMMVYSLPLIPGGVCLWVLSAADRFFIKEYLSLHVNQSPNEQ